MREIIVDGRNTMLSDVNVGETFTMEDDFLYMVTQSDVEREWFIQSEEISVVAFDAGNGWYIMTDKEVKNEKEKTV